MCQPVCAILPLAQLSKSPRIPQSAPAQHTEVVCIPDLLTQLATLFEAQGWTYTRLPDPERLSISFAPSQGAVSLAITAPDAATLAFDALGLGTVDAAHTALLASLDQYLPDTRNLTRQPDDGEVRLRLLLPVPDASLTAEALEEPIGLLLAMAPVFRLALPLVQQGLSPEETIQRAQAAPAPEVAAVPPAIPEALRTLLQELVQLQGHDDLRSLERRRALCQTMLAQLPRQDNHELWAAIHVELGNSCQRLYDITGELTHAQDATKAY